MLDKFNFYDLLGYLIPGAAAIALIYWVGTPLVTGSIPGLKGDLPDFSSSLGGAILLVALAYAVGHLVQSVGALWEESGNHGRKARLSELMLAPKETTFSPDLIGLLRARGQQVFGLPDLPELSGDYDSDSNIRLREFFELCYRAIVQKNVNQHTDLYLAISGLSRGVLVVSWLGIGLSVLLIGLESQRSGGLGSDAAHLAYGLIPTLALSWYLAHTHYFRFRHYFAMSVWTNFYFATMPVAAPGG